jgi:hypothetical protein
MCIKLSKTYPFVVFTSGSREGGSEHVPLGASVSQRPPTDNVQRFLSMLRFDSREKANASGRYADAETDKTGM